MINLELELDEAEKVLAALNNYDNAPVAILLMLSELIDMEKEIQNMDFDDCAGGACKL